MAAPSNTTPLLVLLDGILLQEFHRVEPALREIGELVFHVKGVPLETLGWPASDRLLLEGHLYTVVKLLLSDYPELCAIPSSIDKSLPLHFAASLGNVQVVDLLLHQYPRAAFTSNSKGKIPLHYAARQGRTNVVQCLLSHAPQTATMASRKQKLALHFAAGDGHVDIVQHLLHAYPAGASWPSAKGKLPLHFAARWNHLPIVQKLLTYYPEGIQALDYEGSSPLHEACREGQYMVARYLAERFPEALQTANIRGEIPLFPAVRSGNIELVVSLIQAWPMGGREILKNVSADDRIQDWDEQLPELLLRGAVFNFDGCTLFKGTTSPILTCCSKCCPRWASSTVAQQQTQQTWNSDSQRPRSKSPLLQARKRAADDEKAVMDSKKARFGYNSYFTGDAESVCEYCSALQCKSSKFVALHAALRCEASLHVLKHILQQSKVNDLEEKDHEGCLPLHWAVTRCAGDEADEAVDWCLSLLEAYPAAASAREHVYQRLPLHMAIASRADSRVVTALLRAFPEAGAHACRTNDEWYDQKLVPMACHYDCDVSSVFELLKANPSYLANARQL